MPLFVYLIISFLMKRHFFVAATLSLALTNATAANETGKTKADSVKTVALQEVQVLSTRAGETTPITHTDISKSQIKSMNYGKDVPFILSLTPSVTTTSDAGNGIGYTSIRVRGTDPTRINITANGIPINDAESSNVYWTNIPDFASSVESMQIQRGVGTSTNGAGAFGATINMQTENIGVKPFGGIDLSAGSYGSHKETFRFGTGLINGHWGFQGRLSNVGSDGYIDRASSKLDSYFLQGGYFSDNTVVKFITFNGKEETYHAWNYASLYEMNLYGRRYNSCGYMYTDEDGNMHFYDNQIDYYHQQHYQLLWNQILSRELSLNVALHYTKGFGYYEEYKDGRTLAEYTLTNDWSKTSDLVRRKQMDNDFYGAIASLNYNNRKGLKATIGGGWNKYDGDHYGNVLWVKNFDEDIEPNHKYYDNNAKKTDGNIYGKVNYEFIKGLSAYVDLQYRHVNYKMSGPCDAFDYDTYKQIVFNEDNSFDFFNPKAGIFWQMNNNHQAYASFAISHREPTRNDYEDNLGEDLKAERLYDWELGYKFTTNRFSAGVNFYYMTYNDQFVLTGELNNIGEMIARNVGESYRMGVELQAAWQPVDWLRWDANATWSRNRAKDWHITLSDTGESVTLGDTPLSFSPDFIFNNIFTFNWKGLSASLQSQYIGEQYLTNTGIKSYISENENGGNEVSMMIDSYFVTNLDLSYTFKLKGLKSITLGCTVYNLFSEKYMNNGWSAPGYKKNADGKVIAYTEDDEYETGYAAQAPINFMAHLSLTF